MSLQSALWSGFVNSAERFADRSALFAGGETRSYDELREAAFRIAATLQAYPEFSETPLTAVFAYRNPTAFAGVLGSLLAGNGYVPLNRTFPPGRTRTMFQLSESRSIIVDGGSLPQLNEVLASEPSILVVLPDIDDVSPIRSQWPGHVVLGSADIEPAARWGAPNVNPDAIAYLLFTSGSTGVPKGVMVAHRNVIALLESTVDQYQITKRDRLSQMFDMTFDLSVFDMFAAWERGASLYCPSQKALINPGAFLKNSELTVWFSAPSTAVFMKRLGMLKANRYPSLRLSLFCGEPLPVATALAWSEAAPNSMIENLYGPTELTVACTRYRWDASRSPAESELGIVPIGHPFSGMTALVADERLKEVPPGHEGELLMTGPQTSLGYWNDSKKTSATFVTPPDRTEVYYKTGDRVRRPLANGPLTHLGRIDHQIKIRGHRVELGEIEAVVRNTCGFDAVVALGWPVTENGYEAVEVFVEGEEGDVDSLRRAVALTLPDYMVPRRFHFLESLPLNPNSKFDRKAMARLLEEGL